MNSRILPIALVIALIGLPGGISKADPRQPPLKSLYDGHRWFALRDAVTRGRSPVFYRGAVEAAFNDTGQARQDLGAFIRQSPHDSQVYEAHRLLAGVYLRTGHYREARDETDAMAADSPSAADIRQVAPILRALARHADQRVVERREATIQMSPYDGSLAVPTTVNGNSAQYFLDTDASVSLLSESEAKRLGLEVEAVPATVEGMSGPVPRCASPSHGRSPSVRFDSRASLSTYSRTVNLRSMDYPRAGAVSSEFR